jgi:hypothetical protein
MKVAFYAFCNMENKQKTQQSTAFRVFREIMFHFQGIIRLFYLQICVFLTHFLLT